MQKQITEGSILKNLAFLSWPVVLAMVMHTGYNLVDIYWVGKLGPTSTAAVALAGIAFFIILAIGQTIGSGTVALVARSYGAGNTAQATHIVRQSLILSALVALVVCGLGFFYAPGLIRLLGGEGEVFTLGSQYLKIAFVGFFFQLLTFNINYAFRGTGDMITPMVIMLAATLLNIVLDPLLILGYGFFPRLEVAGAAYATVIAKSFSFVVALLFLLGGRSGLRLPDERGLRLEGPVVKTLLGIGLPVGISYGLMTASWMMIFRVVAHFGPHVLAALGIGMRVVQMAGLPIVGIGIATTTLIGQNLGAMKKDRAQKIAVRSMLLSLVLMIAATLFFFFKAEALIQLFSDDPSVIEEGTLLLKTVSGYLVLTGLTLSMAGVFRGSGDTKPPMFGGLIRLALLLSLAPLLSRVPQLGVQGVWFSMVISFGMETLFLGSWFRKGRWRDKRIELLEDR